MLIDNCKLLIISILQTCCKGQRGGNGYATAMQRGLKKASCIGNGPTMDRQCIDIGPRIHRERRVERALRSKSKVESRKTVRLGGLKDELFMGPKLPKIKENYIFTDYTD